MKRNGTSRSGTVKTDHTFVAERLKKINEIESFGVLATDDNGQPYTSLIAFALTEDVSTVLFATSKSTRKYKNLLRKKQVSLLLDTRSLSPKNLLDTEAVTLLGVARPVKRGKKWNELVSCFLAKHPALEEFVRAKGTALIRLTITSCIHVKNFQTITVWNVRS